MNMNTNLNKLFIGIETEKYEAYKSRIAEKKTEWALKNLQNRANQNRFAEKRKQNRRCRIAEKIKLKTKQSVIGESLLDNSWRIAWKKLFKISFRASFNVGGSSCYENEYYVLGFQLF